MRSILLVICYLMAIVAANLSVQVWGQIAMIGIAWLIIPFDFVVRDVLHLRWEGRGVFWRLSLLIMAGAILTTLCNLDAWRIGAASAITFIIGGAVNTFLFVLLNRIPIFNRMVVSNSITSIVDSILFPLLALGYFSVWISAGQAVSKILGSVLWAFIFRGRDCLTRKNE